MAIELGQAYVQIMPSAKGISGSIQKQIDPEALSAGKSAGGKIMSGMADSLGKLGSSLTKKITLPAVAVATAVGGIVAAFGWGRLKALDSAQAQLKGLGYAVADVERISEQVKNAVQGTTMTMAEGTSVAAGALAAGVAEGAELEKYIRLVGNAAVGANRPMADMAQIFNRVQGSGKLMTQELNMIEDGMPGFAQTMADSLGVTQGEFKKMVTAGKVSSEQFLEVMDDFAGEMSEAYANSWEGMVSNTKAYIGILGENLLGGVFEQSKESIAEFMEFLNSDKVQAWAEQAGQKLGQFFSDLVGKIKEAIGWWIGLDDSTKELIGKIALLAVTAGPVLTIISKLIAAVSLISKGFGALKGAAAAVGVAMGAISWPIVAVIAAVAALIAIFVTLYKKNERFREAVDAAWAGIKEIITTVIKAVSDFVMDIFGGLVDWWNENSELIMESARVVWEGIKAVIAAVLKFIVPIIKAAWEGIKNYVTAVWNVIKAVIETVINVIKGIIKAVMQIITGDWSGAWETIKETMSAVWDGIKSIVDAVINLIKTIISGAWNSIKAITSSVWNAIKDAISAVWNGIKTTIDTVINFIKDIVSRAWNSIKETTSNVWNGIKDTVSNIINSIKGTFSNIFNSLKETVTTAFSNVKEAVKTGMTNAWETVTGFFDKFKNAGKNIVQSIADGIKSAIGAVTRAISNVTQKVRNFLPFSPAKEGPLKDLDKLNFGGTISLGIDDGTDEVQKAMEKMLIMPKIKHQFETAGGEGRGNRGIVQNITVNSPKELSPSETARQVKNASRQLAMGW